MKNKIVHLDYDTRMIEWNLKHEVINQEELKKYLMSLPDEQANAVNMSLDEEVSTDQSSN